MIVWYTMYIYTYFPTPGTELRRAFWTGRSLTKTPKCGDDYCSQWFDLSSVSIPILLRCFFLIQNPPQINFPVLPTACRGMVFPWVFTAFKWLLIQLNFCDGSWLLGNKLKEWWKGRWKIPCRLGYIWVMDSCICSLVDPQIHIWLFIYIYIYTDPSDIMKYWSCPHAPARCVIEGGKVCECFCSLHTWQLRRMQWVAWMLYWWFFKGGHHAIGLSHTQRFAFSSSFAWSIPKPKAFWVRVPICQPATEMGHILSATDVPHISLGQFLAVTEWCFPELLD